MNTTPDETTEFTPKYGPDGLIACITQSVLDGTVLMFAWMNEEALKVTLETEEMHYWSRSRQELWHKGKTSGDIQKLVELKIDCDQDCLLAIVDVAPEPAREKACHTGRRSCFYRTLHSKDGSIALDFKSDA